VRTSMIWLASSNDDLLGVGFNGLLDVARAAFVHTARPGISGRPQAAGRRDTIKGVIITSW
jgi:hypothetical protein